MHNALTGLKQGVGPELLDLELASELANAMFPAGEVSLNGDSAGVSRARNGETSALSTMFRWLRKSTVPGRRKFLSRVSAYVIAMEEDLDCSDAEIVRLAREERRADAEGENEALFDLACRVDQETLRAARTALLDDVARDSLLAAVITKRLG